MSILTELFAFFRTRRKFWLAPVVLMMVIFGTLLIVAQSTAVAPFIYTIF